MNPISNLILYNCKLDRTMHKTIDFSSQSARDTYFSSNSNIATIISIPYSGNAYFIRENKTVKVPINADVLDANGVNYCRFNNPQSGTNNYFYCFIDNIEYAAPQTAILYLRTDVMLTNVCNYSASNCFVERQHIAKVDDVYYNQLTPESIDYGDIVEYSVERITPNLSARTVSEFDNNYSIIINMSDRLHGDNSGQDSFIGGVENTSFYYSIANAGIDELIDYINQHGQVDAIINIYCLPTDLINLQLTNVTISHYNIYSVNDLNFTDIPTYNITGSFTMANGYTPRNKKLLCYPYDFLNICNFNGSSIDLKYENNPNTQRNFAFKNILSAGNNPSLIVFPVFYNVYSDNIYNEYMGNYEYAIEFNNFPELSWKSDTYATYLALNKNSLQSQKMDMTVRNVSNLINSKSVSDIANNLTNATMDYMRFDASLRDMQNIPDKIHGHSSGGTQLLSGSAGIFARKKSIKPLFAEKIDKYFDMFGYNISNVQTPNWTNRSHYNFVKTSGIDIYGTIAKDDKQKIAEIFDSGVTFWHISNYAVYGIYDTNNV